MTDASRIETKRAALTIAKVDEQGIFEGYASLFNVVDLGGDIVMPGAFARTLLSTCRFQRTALLCQRFLVLGFTPQYPTPLHSQGSLLVFQFSTRLHARPPPLPRAQAARDCVYACTLQGERRQLASSCVRRLQNANTIQIWVQQLCVFVCVSRG